MSVPVSREELEAFCRRWDVAELRVFGSAARGELTESSDIDLLYRFIDHDRWAVFDLIQMQAELEVLLRRKVDLISLESVEHSANLRARHAILNQARVLYPHAA